MQGSEARAVRPSLAKGRAEAARDGRHRPCPGTRVRTLALGTVFALVGCGDGNGGSAPAAPVSDGAPPNGSSGSDGAGPPGDTGAVGAGGEPQAGEPGADEPGADGFGTDDPDGDDRPGLVVESLDGQAPEDLVAFWLADATFSRSDARPGSGDAAVGLTGYVDGLALDAFVDFYAPALDVCTLNRSGSDDGAGEGGSGSAPPFVSGGPSVTVNTPAGPWFTIDAGRFGEGGEALVYAVNDALPGALPDDATLSIPGDAFPTVAAFALPDEPAAPVRLLPGDGERLGAETVYTWVPGNGSEVVEMRFVALDAETGVFVDFPVVCTVVDDGEFALPDEARAFLEATTDDVRVRYGRARDVLAFADGIVFRTRVAVAE